MTDWIDIGTLADIPQRGARTVHIGGEKEIAVFLHWSMNVRTKRGR